MIANSLFAGQPPDFWANVKLISQKSGYTERGTGRVKVPNQQEIDKVYEALGLDRIKVFRNDLPTILGTTLMDYFEHRASVLNNDVVSNLMSLKEAEQIFYDLKVKIQPQWPVPLNKQKGNKKAPAYFTGIINMLIEMSLKGNPCDYDPKTIPFFSMAGFPVRCLSRRVDGAYPSTVDPIAIWEIKEYYYTTTFGSRVADGIYETQLDGYELNEIRNFCKRDVRHYLMVDDYNTWWNMGKSYLCRIVDMLHMGLLSEALFGREVIDRIPVIVAEWLARSSS